MYGLLCSADGCPVAIEVFDGNTGDPSTVGHQIAKLKESFGLKRVLMVGDRGMITDARIREDLKPAELDWITALRAPSLQKLTVEEGPSLFDERDLVEIESPDFPGERLIVCKNPSLAEERRHKRDELLDATEKDLKDIQKRITRKRKPLCGADEIGLAGGKLIGCRKVGKHFDMTITDEALSFTRNTTRSPKRPRSTASTCCAPMCRIPPIPCAPTKASPVSCAPSAASRPQTSTFV